VFIEFISMKNDNDPVKIIYAYRNRQAMANFYGLLLVIFLILIIVGIWLFFSQLPFSNTPATLASPTPTEIESDTIFATPPTHQIAEGEPPLVLEHPSQPFDESEPLSTTIYEVKEGDTLGGIALRFNLDLPALLALNPQIDPDLLTIGQKIIVPNTAAQSTPAPVNGRDFVEYQVVAGDTLLAIAERFNSTIGAIVAANDLENEHAIQAGDTLRIPANLVPTNPPTNEASPDSTP
jgi:LysM repeat protein